MPSQRQTRSSSKHGSNGSSIDMDEVFKVTQLTNTTQHFNTSMTGKSLDEKLDFLCTEIAKLSVVHTALHKLEKSVDKLNEIINEKDDKIHEQSDMIATLEDKVDELEQYTRRDDVIITGFDSHHKTMARALMTNLTPMQNGEAPNDELMTLEDSVVNYLNMHNIDIAHSDISICHTLGVKKPNKPQPIVVRLVMRKAKNYMLSRQRHALKGTGVRISEHLTQKNSALAYHARQLYRDEKIDGTFTRNCRVFVKIANGTDNPDVEIIKSMEDIEKYQSV